MKRLTALLLSLLLLLSLAACGGGSTPPPSAENPPAENTGGAPGAQEPEVPDSTSLPENPVVEPQPPAEKEPYEILDPKVMPEGGERDGVKYAAYDGIVEHLFFHPIIAYPELAFDGDAQANGLDDFMVTVDEFNKILDNVYEKGYVLVDIGDVWSETTDEAGNPCSPTMTPTTIPTCWKTA